MATVRSQATGTQEGGLEELSELKAGLIGTAGKIHLFQSSFVPTPQNVEADFVAAECNFTGYVAVANTFAAPGIDPDDGPTMYGTRALFVATDAVSPNLVGGAWLETQTAAGPPAVHTSVMYCVFNPPVPMNIALAQLNVQPVLQSSEQGYFVVDY